MPKATLMSRNQGTGGLFEFRRRLGLRLFRMWCRLNQARREHSSKKRRGVCGPYSEPCLFDSGDVSFQHTNLSDSGGVNSARILIQHDEVGDFSGLEASDDVIEETLMSCIGCDCLESLIYSDSLVGSKNPAVEGHACYGSLNVSEGIDGSRG